MTSSFKNFLFIQCAILIPNSIFNHRINRITNLFIITAHANSRQFMTQDFLVLSKAEDVALLTQGKDDNKAQDKKDKLEMSTVCVRGSN